MEAEEEKFKGVSTIDLRSQVIFIHGYFGFEKLSNITFLFQFGLMAEHEVEGVARRKVDGEEEGVLGEVEVGEGIF